MFDWLRKLGPGLLFAGAAVGVSHLVYSTQAGAKYGFGLLWVVLAANFFKYPFFEFGPRYNAATGNSLLEGYKKLSPIILGLFIVVTLGTMFTVQAAVTIVTASLASNMIGITDSLFIWSTIILIFCASILSLGQYKVLDTIMKFIIIALTIVTMIAVGIAWSNNTAPLHWAPTLPMIDIAWIIAFIGWMPAPMDLSVWHSLWAVEKRKQKNMDFDFRQSRFDFNIGYIGTIFLAFFFLSLGALVMYTSGQTFSPKGAVFAQQLIDLYTTTLGSGVGNFVAIAAMITMFSTTITCLDALPRSMAKAHQLITNKRENAETPKHYYWLWLLILIIGALLILGLMTANLESFIMLATILSFITTPFFAIVNYKLIIGKDIPSEFRPPLWMHILSFLGFIFLIGFCIVYLIYGLK